MVDYSTALHDIQKSLGRLEGTLGAVHQEVHRLAEFGEQVEDRVDSLEASRDQAKGDKAAVILIAGLIAAAVSAGWKYVF